MLSRGKWYPYNTHSMRCIDCRERISIRIRCRPNYIYINKVTYSPYLERDQDLYPRYVYANNARTCASLISAVYIPIVYTCMGHSQNM
jgi:hypothetical protein